MSILSFGRSLPATSITSCRPVMLACAAAALSGLASSTHASVNNGSFETPPVGTGSFSNHLGGSTAITGWTVLGSVVTLINESYVESSITFNAQDGTQWLDLSGPGSNLASNGVTQDVATMIGQPYRISFYVGSATNNVNIFASTVDLSIAGGPRVSFTNPTAPRNSMDWQLFSVDFVATSDLTNISFFHGSGLGNNLSGLDNVTLELVPTPGAAALLGLGGLVASRRRRVAV
jgi:hypothetical protein